MQKLFGLTGTIAGVAGALICLVTGLARVVGTYHLASYESTTLFSVGTGLMVFACWMRLEELRSR